jgi:hypothetical protein
LIESEINNLGQYNTNKQKMMGIAVAGTVGKNSKNPRAKG